MENMSAVVTLLPNGEYRVALVEGRREMEYAHFASLDNARAHAKGLLRRYKAAAQFETEVYTLEDI